MRILILIGLLVANVSWASDFTCSARFYKTKWHYPIDTVSKQYELNHGQTVIETYEGWKIQLSIKDAVWVEGKHGWKEIGRPWLTIIVDHPEKGRAIDDGGFLKRPDGSITTGEHSSCIGFPQPTSFCWMVNCKVD
jgi:hypothetical protein